VVANPGVSEEELVQKCREGDRGAQRELYARTSDRIYRLLLRMTGRAEDAFDLTQDTYLKVFAAIQRFEGHCGVETWIYRIAVNEARQFLRRQRLQQHKLRFLRTLRDPEPAPADEGLAVQVRDALGRLPLEERTLLILRHFDELSYNEMAEVLEKPPGTIASSLNRARRMLRNLLEEDLPAGAKIPCPEGI